MLVQFLHKLQTDGRGTSVIELAMFAPIAGMMIVGITDLSRAFSAQVTLTQAVNRALEKAAVAPVQNDYTFLQAEAAAAATVTPDKVSVEAWLECDRARQAAFDGACEAGQMVTRYVRVRVTGSFKPIFGYGAFGLKLFATGTDGTMPITVSKALRVQ